VKIGQRVVEILIKAKDDASGPIKTLGKSFDELERQVPLLGQAFDLIKNPIAQVIVILASLGKAAMTAYRANVQLGAAMDDLSKRTGQSVESLSKWAYVAELGGSSIADFESSFLKLRKSMADAVNGSQMAIDSFATLGVAFKNSDGTMRDIEAVMLDIGEALRVFGPESLQGAAAQDVLGRSSAAFVATLRQGREELKLQTAAAKVWGAEMDSSFIKKVTEADDAAIRLRTAWGKLTQEMTPALAKVTEAAGVLAIMLSGRLTEATQAAWDAEQEFRENFRLFDEAKLNAGANAMIAAVERARVESVARMTAADKEIADLSAKIAESMVPAKDRSMLDIDPRLGEGADDGLMLWEDYEEAARKLLTVQEEIDAYGLPDPLNAMKIAEANAEYEALVKQMEEAAAAAEQMTFDETAAADAAYNLTSGLGSVASQAVTAFAMGTSGGMFFGRMIREVIIKAVTDLIVQLTIVKGLMKIFALPFAKGGTVPGMALGGTIPRAAMGYAIPDGPRGMDSRLILGMPGEEVINRSLSRRLDRFISAYEMSATVSPFALAGAGGGGAVINFNVGRPVSVLDALDLGRNAVTASRKYAEASL